jgi:hypothetical protein
MGPIVGYSSCYGSAPDESEKYVVCTYAEEAVKPDFAGWVVVAYYDRDQKITSLDVVRSTEAIDVEKIVSRGKAKPSAKSDVKFKFEDCKVADQAKKKLFSLFPLGSKVEDFMALMRSLNAECYGPVPGDREGSICRYKEKEVGFITKVWIVSFNVTSAGDLELSDVKTGRVGP